MLVRFIAALAIATALPARAATSMTDASDLWWNPSESGWGLNIVHQADTLFATLFVYEPSREPNWYVASEMTLNEGGTFSGPLYRTSGPWFGGPFDPAGVGIRQVGTATFAYRSADTATLSYVVDGVSVTKSIARQTVKHENLSGSYIGALVGTYSGCSLDGVAEERVDLNVQHTTTGISFEILFGLETCTYSGTYSQAGRMGRVEGTVDCGNGEIGPFTLSEVVASRIGIGGVGTVQYRECRWTGRFGGVRIGLEP
jgi:hypothetical protein